MKCCRLASPAGFTLLEMAVVLSVIALIIGAVVGGLNLLKQSELQTVVSDYSKYASAVDKFRAQYGGPPGDLVDATNYWGDDTTSVADCDDGDATSDGTPGTCNGNADDKIRSVDDTYNADGSANVVGTNFNETYRAWQQLVLAKYIDGNFTGYSDASGNINSVPGTNVPRSRVTGAGWSFGYKESTSGDANQFDQELKNYLAFGKTITNGLTQGAAITPTDAWLIDTKMDDGKSGTGRVVSMKPVFTSTPNCSSNPTPGTDTAAAYSRTYTLAACGLNMSLTQK